MSFIELHDVSKYYATSFRKVNAVHHLTLSFERGEFVAITGKSGSGKSTVLKLLSGILLADSGSIRVNDVQLNMLKEEEILSYRRKQIGIVFQSFELLPYHNVLENILLPLYLNDLIVEESEVDILMQELDILHLKNSFPDELSGGEQQRVAIARAMIHHPDILLLDEPTGNLDSQNTIILMEMLKKIHKSRDITILMVTHDNDVSRYASRTIILKDGNIDFNQ